MDINSMMSTIEANKHAGRVASSLATHASGISTSATATRPRAAAAAPATTGATASATTSATAGATTSSDDITSNDFLTLLVTEMQNQDPTQPTDPNAYIQQLVGVNSLQQLISINQELGVVTGSSTGSSVKGVSGVSGAAAVTAPTPDLFSTQSSGAPGNQANS